MSNWVKFMCHADGNVIISDDGVGYDRGPKTFIKVDVGTQYVKFVEIVAEELEIDLVSCEVKISHRYPMTESGRTEYVLMPIKNDKDVFLLIDFAIDMGKDKCQQLFVKTRRIVEHTSSASLNTPIVPLARALDLQSGGSNASMLVRSGNEDGNNEGVQLFSKDSNLVVADQEFEVPLPYYRHLGGSGYITFEEDHRRGESSWSFSDELKKGMRWDTKDDLIHAVKMHHVVNHHEYKVVRSDKRTWSVSCVNAEKGCNWRLCASKKKKDDAFEISVVGGPHTCVNLLLSTDHRQLDSAVVARAVDAHVREAPDLPVSLVRTIVGDKFGYDCTWRRAYEAKQKAVVNVYGDWGESYNKLPHLLNAIKEANEGTVVEWYYSPTNDDGVAVFERVFWAFGPCIEAFEHIRPVISIDGTFLYGKYRHKLLIACGMDGANHIVPLAFALVDEESRASWSWFLKLLKKYIVRNVEGPLCLISDRHVGIRAAVDDVDVGWKPPFAYWRFCIRHVVSNYNDRVKNASCKDGVQIAAMQAQPMKCMKYLELVKERKDGALDYFTDIPYEQWTLSHDGGFRYGYMTTNLSESYNAILKGARKLPIASLVKKTFYNCVGYFKARRAEAHEALNRGESYTKFCDDKFSRWSAVATKHRCTMFSDHLGVFDVSTGHRSTERGYKGGHRHIVDIKAGVCTCQKWQTYRIPCSHACAAFASVVVDVSPHVGRWFSWSHQLSVYNGQFRPYAVEAYWGALDLPLIIPNPQRQRPKGRPRSTRIHNEMDVREPATKITCSICRQKGHNRRSCPTNKASASSSSHMW